MAIIDVAIPSSQTATTTINAGPGDVINIPAGMMGNITINGGPDVTINILGDPDPGSTFGQLTLGGFGSDIEPTVNIPAGVDFSRYPIDSNGQNLTLNVGDGATLAGIDATGMSNTGTLTINAGNDVTVDGSINNYGADADFTFGSGATVTGTTTATSVGDANVTFGDNATFGGTVALSDGGNTANVNATFGDGLDVTGQITAGNDGAEMNIAIGNDATISNALNLTGQAPTNLTIGDNATILGNINLASSEDTVVIGDNWDLANINMGLGDDNLTIGQQAVGANNTVIDGGNPQGIDTDGITITARPDQVAAFQADGWIDNGDGTWSSPPAAFNGSPMNGPGIAIQDFEGAAAPLPNDPPVIDPIADTTTPENSTDPVFTASATDPDGDPVTYSLSGDDAALFNIDPATGEVTPIAPLDFENPTDTNGDGVYDITVVATDPNDPTLFDEEPVAITVGDVDEAPVLDPITDPTIPENSTAPVFTANAVDPDGEAPVYSLTGDDAALFNIDPATGEVTPIAALDFENPTDSNGDGVYDITVVATDPNDPTLFDEEPVAITVGDVNEADGVVDGETTGESMTPGYDDANGPTDGGGDVIGAGNDSIEGNGGDDTIDAGAGNDTVDGGADDDSITGGDGDDSVLGGDGADTLAGGEGTDTLDGGAGDDDIAVGGDDTGLGGSGDDVFTIDPTDPAPDVAVTIDGGTDGTVPGEEAGPENGDEGDVLDLSGETGDLDVVLATDPESGTVDGIDTIAGDDDITFDEIEKVLTGTGDDSIDGGSSTGPIDVETGGGDDTVAGGTGDDTIDGGDDNDSIDGGDGDDSIAGGAGTDTLTGGLGADTIDGGAGDDDITVGAGDLATGGSGDDDFFLDPTNTDGPDTITIDGGTDGTSGFPDDLANDDDGDTLDFTGLDNVTIVTPLVDDGTGSFSGQVSYTNDEGEVITVDFTEIENVLGLPGGPDGVVDGETTGELMDVGYDDANGPTDGGGDQITNNADSIEGNGGDDTINGGGGNDTIDGGDDDDVIDGGLGDASVLGGDGADSVVGGDGADTIYGGSNVPADNLIDDNIDPGQNDPDTLNGQDTLDGGAGNDVIFGEDDDDNITGGTGNDSLDGGIDDDTLSGGDGEDTLIGGQGADSMSGGLGNDTFLVGTFDDPNNPGDSYIEGIGDTIVGGEDPGDTDTDTLDLTGSGPLTVIPSAPGAEDGIVEFYSDPAKTNLIGTLAYSEIENIIPCFTPGTLIATMKGEVPVESLQEGDKVITRDNGIQEIRWIGKRTLQRDELRRAPHLSPILIKAGSLGDGLPERDMMVSPQHRMLVAGDQTQLYFEEPEVLVAAKHLINNGSIQAIDTLRATYIHFMFDQHEVVLADGAWTESFQPGDQTLGAMGTAQRNEILELFPDLEMQTGRDDYVAARRVLKGYEAKLLKG